MSLFYVDIREHMRLTELILILITPQLLRTFHAFLDFEYRIFKLELLSLLKKCAILLLGTAGFKIQGQ